MKNYTIVRKVYGTKKSRTPEYSYSIKKDGKFLCRGASKVTFSSEKKAVEFAEDFDETNTDYRWF